MKIILNADEVYQIIINHLYSQGKVADAPLKVSFRARTGERPVIIVEQ